MALTSLFFDLDSGRVGVARLARLLHALVTIRADVCFDVKQSCRNEGSNLQMRTETDSVLLPFISNTEHEREYWYAGSSLRCRLT